MKVVINNFQSIKSAELNFKGFTAITGKSDMGKSAVRRAIQTALFNTWDSSFRRINTKRTYIELETDSTQISVIKSNTENQFTVNGKTHYKMGREKPDLKLFSEDLNITTQLEPLFMVSYKDTENTKILNNLFGIERIETAQQFCSKDLRDVKQSLKIHKENKESLDVEIQELENNYYKFKELDDFIKETTYFKILIQDYYNIKSEEIQSSKDVKDCGVKVSRVQSILDTLQAYQHIEAYLEMTRKIRHLKTQQDIDNERLVVCKGLMVYIEEKEIRLKRMYNYIRISKEIKNTKITDVQFSKIKGMSSVLKYLEICEKLGKAEKKMSEIENSLTEVVKKIGNEEICPYCKQPIKKENK